MYPCNLEILLMLKFNRWLWDIELVNSVVLGSSSEEVAGTFDEDDEAED